MVLKVCGDTKQSAFHELSIGEAEIEIFIDFKERFIYDKLHDKNSAFLDCILEKGDQIKLVIEIDNNN